MIPTDTNTFYCQNKWRTILWLTSPVLGHINNCSDIPQLLNHNDLDYQCSDHYNYIKVIFLTQIAISNVWRTSILLKQKPFENQERCNTGAVHVFCIKHDILNESHILTNIATFHVSGLIRVYNF